MNPCQARSNSDRYRVDPAAMSTAMSGVTAYRKFQQRILLRTTSFAQAEVDTT